MCRLVLSGDDDAKTMATCVLINALRSGKPAPLRSPLMDRRGSNDDSPTERFNFEPAKEDEAESAAAGLGVHVHDVMRWQLLERRDFLDALVADVDTLHRATDVSRNVLAGYTAIVLALLSLSDTNARLAVVGAISRRIREARRDTAKAPLRWVVAILQEFLLFQSSAGILTRDMLVLLEQLTAALKKENGITDVAAAE